jgi:predicted glycosyltransferase
MPGFSSAIAGVCGDLTAPRGPADLRAAPRVMFYSLDTFGLGHPRRAVTLARHFREQWPGMAQLIVTGSPVPNRYRLASGADYVELPSAVKVGAGRYVSRSLTASFDDVLSLRKSILVGVSGAFRPDVLVVDHAPAGLKGELIPTLRHLKRHFPATRLILCLRDVVDEPPRVRRDWTREGVYELLDNLYDRILVIGRRDIYDPVGEYRLSPRAVTKACYVGYLRRAADRPATAVRRELGLSTGRLVVVTSGGGRDGYELHRCMLEALPRDRAEASFDCLLVSGPLMAEKAQQELERTAAELESVNFLRFVGDLAPYIAAADVVVSMAGHNSVSEILSFGRPAVLVPRLAPRSDQAIRAEALSRRGLVRKIDPKDLSPDRLLAEVHDLLEHPDALAPPFRLDGLPAVTAELKALLQDQARGLEPRRMALEAAAGLGAGRA